MGGDIMISLHKRRISISIPFFHFFASFSLICLSRKQKRLILPCLVKTKGEDKRKAKKNKRLILLVLGDVATVRVRMATAHGVGDVDLDLLDSNNVDNTILHVGSVADDALILVLILGSVLDRRLDSGSSDRRVGVLLSDRGCLLGGVVDGDAARTLGASRGV
jgi:hypothetical protein